MPALAVLSLGSNVPADGLSPPEILRAACGMLADKLSGFRASSVYRTKPLYCAEQDDFFNLVCAGAWEKSAEELLDFTQGIESAFGRDRTRELPKGPRTLDIDIALFGAKVVSAPRLRIPHPGITERAFVLVPLLEILPQAVDPLSGRKYESFLDCIGERGVELCDEHGKD
jgi:2-amino-4-hydroxy-6-hydroxymethyldihydropteridine diphosphokinase